MNAIDTNVLLYSVDRHEPTKQRIAQQLVQQLRDGNEPTLLLWQVLGELTAQLRPWRDQGAADARRFRATCSGVSLPVSAHAAHA
jgi:predicted nucleic acid-binding protein